jgi:hypothetical protein
MNYRRNFSVFVVVDSNSYGFGGDFGSGSSANVFFYTFLQLHQERHCFIIAMKGTELKRTSTLEKAGGNETGGDLCILSFLYTLPETPGGNETGGDL